MRFIGGKTQLLPDILDLIKSETSDVKTISDLFSGSGVVTRFLSQNNFATYSNDLMYFSYLLLRGSSSISSALEFEGLKAELISDPIDFFNTIPIEKIRSEVCLEDCFIFCNYSPYGCRKYFTEDNALRIDYIRMTIEKWRSEVLITDDEYFYLLCALIEAVPFVSNTTGVYGAYLKHWDSRAHKPLELSTHWVNCTDTPHIVYNTDTMNIVSKLEVDLAYYDPPYNQRQYLPNYHLLETIARYDYPEISGKTGLRNYEQQKSLFCSKSKVYNEMQQLIERTNARYIIVSYNSEGLLTEDEIKEILVRYGHEETLKVVKKGYSRYKNASTKRDNNLTENLYFIRRK